MHLRFGPLEIVTAYTPAHSYPRTMTYRHATDHDTLLRVVRGHDPPATRVTRKVKLDDAGLRGLQRRIERAGGRHWLAGRTEERRTGLWAPIAEEEART